MTIEFCRAEQLRCAEQYHDAGARLGMFDWFAEEFLMTYEEFLTSKAIAPHKSGFDPGPIHEKAKDFQRDIIEWALKRGRAAIFADTGLGKTFMQLEWARHVSDNFGPVLILAPLAVAAQTVREAAKFGINDVEHVSEPSASPIQVTNYEKLHRFDTSKYAGVVLDESSILKSYMGKTKQALIAAFRDHRFKLACTATPAPNDHLELGNHAEFLSVMESNEMISRWFLNDTMKAGGYRLKKHAAKDFWRWVASWAVSVTMPSDLGYDDAGYDLPPLQMHSHVVSVDVSQDTDGRVFRVPDMSSTAIHKELRRTTADRAAKVAEIVSSPGQWLVWCYSDYEADALLEAIPEAVDVRGSDSTERKEAAADWFCGRICDCMLAERFGDKLAVWKINKKPTGSCITRRTESAELLSQLSTNGSTGREDLNTKESGPKKTRTGLSSIETQQKSREACKENSSTNRTPSFDNQLEKKQKNGNEITQGKNGTSDSKSTGSIPLITSECLANKKEHAQYAQCLQKQGGIDCMSIIATNQESSGGCCALPVTLQSDCSTTSNQGQDKLICTCEGTQRKKILISKPSIFGMGLNFQHCNQVAFVGLSYSFESYYQAIRRVWRFGQTKPVQCHIVQAETEGALVATIETKEREFRSMRKEMTLAMRDESIRQLRDDSLVLQLPNEERRGEGWQLYHADCVAKAREIADNTIGLSVFSPPFSNLYIYSDSIADMGNTDDDEQFMEQFRYLIRELFRITIPGRNCAVHCKDLPLYRGRDGAAGLRDFPGRIIREFEAEGWTFHSRVTIWKDPVIEMQRTKNHGLLYKQLCADSAASRQGMADYIITFRKWNEEADFLDPVTANGERFDEYKGLEPPDAAMVAYDAGVPVPAANNGKWPRFNPFARGSEAFRLWSIMVWQKYASPVWMDINQTDVLNKGLARDGDDERHICPLQLDVIERCIHLWSNPGDIVFSPFTGIGSEGYVALKCGRRFIGTELKKGYFDIACRNLADASGESNRQLSLLEVSA